MSALKFRNIVASVDDPVETWPFEGILTAVERGTLPDWRRLAAWLGVLVSFVLTLLGPTFGLADWALGISPFWHVPNIQAAHPDLSGLLWISLFTAGFLAVGFTGFRRRDLAR